MGESPTRRSVVVLCALNLMLVGAVVYLSIAGARTTAVSTEPSPCPPCSPAPKQRPPLFPKLFQPVEFTTDFYGMRYRGHSGNLIDEHVLYLGAYEKDVLHCMRDVAKALGPDTGVFIDVGANTGLHSLFMSKHLASVHAFEPYPPVLVRFRAALDENKIENVTVHPVGLGDTRAEVPFNAPPENNLGSGSFVADFQPGNKPSGSLAIVVGDQALKEAGVEKVAIVKMDIEGYERPALRGLRETLERSRPVVFVEITIDSRLSETYKSEDELRGDFPENYSFRAFVQTPRNAYTGKYTLRAPAFNFESPGQVMLLAAPNDKRAALAALGLFEDPT